MKFLKPMLAMLLILMPFSLAACDSETIAVTSPADNAITVTAVGEVRTVPDKARITVGVTTRASAADQAQTDNAEMVDAVVEALMNEGVSEESIQTTYTNLSPIYDDYYPYGYDSADDSVPGDSEVTPVGEEVATGTTGLVEKLTGSLSETAPGDATGIAGYTMSTMLAIDDLDIAAVGTVIESCTAAGATDVSGIEYYSSTYDDDYQTALAQAMEAASGKARVLADAAGVALGPVVDVEEGYEDTGYRYLPSSSTAYDTAEAMVVEPGQITVSATVTVSYAVR